MPIPSVLVYVFLLTAGPAQAAAPDSGFRDKDVVTYDVVLTRSSDVETTENAGAEICVMATLGEPSIPQEERIGRGVFRQLGKRPARAGESACQGMAQDRNLFVSAKTIPASAFYAATWNEAAKESKLPSQSSLSARFSGSMVKEAYAQLQEACRGKPCSHYRVMIATSSLAIAFVFPLDEGTRNWDWNTDFMIAPSPPKAGPFDATLLSVRFLGESQDRP